MAGRRIPERVEVVGDTLGVLYTKMDEIGLVSWMLFNTDLVDFDAPTNWTVIIDTWLKMITSR